MQFRPSRALVLVTWAILINSIAPVLPAQEPTKAVHEMSAMQPAGLSGARGSINGLRKELATQIAATCRRDALAKGQPASHCRSS